MEPFGQGIGVRRFLHQLLKPSLRLDQLFWSLQINSGALTEGSPHCFFHRSRKGVAKKSPASLDELIYLVSRQRPGDHAKRLRAPSEALAPSDFCVRHFGQRTEVPPLSADQG